MPSRGYKDNSTTGTMAEPGEGCSVDSDADTTERRTAREKGQCRVCFSRELLRRCRTCLGGTQCEPMSSWIILAAVFGTNFLHSLPDVSFGIFYDHFQDKYQTTKAAIGWIFFVFSISGSLTGLLVSPFVTLYGCRVVAVTSSIIYALGMCLTTLASTLAWCIVCFGLIAGIGFGGTFLSAMTIVQQCFTHNRGMATGISGLGFSFGIIICPVLLELFLQQYGFSGALLLHGGLYVQGIVFAALLKSPQKYIQQARSKAEAQPMLPEKDELVADKSEKDHETIETIKKTPKQRQGINDIFRHMLDFSPLKSVPFVLLILHTFLLIVSRFGIRAHIVSAAVHSGVSPTDAGYLFTIMGICNLVVRMASIVIMNFKKVNPLLYTSVGTLLLSLSGMAAAFADSYGIFVLSMVFEGCYGGIANTVLAMVIVYIVGVHKFARSVSILKVCTIPAPLLGAPFAGWLFDITGNYTVSFGVIALSAALSTILAVVIYVLMRFRYKQPERPPNSEPDPGNEEDSTDFKSNENA